MIGKVIKVRGIDTKHYYVLDKYRFKSSDRYLVGELQLAKDGEWELKRYGEVRVVYPGDIIGVTNDFVRLK